MKFERFSEKQLLTLTWWSDASPYRDWDAVICDGAVRSGKTLCMGISFLCWAMRRFDGQNFALCGKTIASLRRNVVSVLLPVMGDLGFQCREKISHNQFTVEYGGRRNTFHLFGGQHEGSPALIQGITLAGVLLDEVALMPRAFVEQALARCSVTGSKFWFNCNPEGPQHWFYLEWIRKAAQRHALYLHFSLEDNPSLSRRVIARYREMYSGVFYRRFVLGEWVAPRGLIYDFFDESYVRAAPPEEQLCEFAVSCDYGTANPASFGLWGRCGEVWYRIAEYYYDSRREGRQQTDAEYVRQLLKLVGGRKLRCVVVDPSAASFIEALRQADIPVIKAKNDVLSGIRRTADLLQAGKLVITPDCSDALREFSLYCWDEDAPNRDRPLKQNDHAMDEIRYFAATVAAAEAMEPVALWVERGGRERVFGG